MRGRLAIVLVAVVTACPSAALAQVDVSRAIVGRWHYLRGNREVQATFDAAGQYATEMRNGIDVENYHGRYRLADGKMTLTPADGAKGITFDVAMADADHLTLTAGTQTLPLTRRAEPVKLSFGTVRAVPGLQPRVVDLAPRADGYIVYTHRELKPLTFGEDTYKLPVPKLYLMTPDGQGRVPYIAAPGFYHAEHPNWTTDGKAVLFSASYNQEVSCFVQDIWAASVDGKTTVRMTGGAKLPKEVKPDAETGEILGRCFFTLASNTDVVNKIDVYWQGGKGLYQSLGNNLFKITGVPAGQKLWIRAYRGRFIGGWTVVDVKAGEQASVVLNVFKGNLAAGVPSLSPDGKVLLSFFQRLYFDYQGLKRLQLAEEYRVQRRKAFGTVVLFDGKAPGAPVADWANFSEKPEHKLSRTPRMSRDGRWIALSVGAYPFDSLLRVTTQSFLAGKPDWKIVQLAKMYPAKGGIGYSDPAFSPDGKRLAFARRATDVSGNYYANLCVCDVDGKNLRQLTRVRKNQYAGQPSFSPDGRKVAYALMTSTDDKLSDVHVATYRVRSDIWVVDLDTGKQIRLTDDGVSTEPAWQPVAHGPAKAKPVAPVRPVRPADPPRPLDAEGQQPREPNRPVDQDGGQPLG